MILRRRLYRASTFQLVAQAASLVLQAVYLAVIARLLPPILFGDLVAAIALLTVAGAVAEFGLLNTAVLEMSERSSSRDVSRVVSETIAAALLAGVVVVVITLPIAAVALGGFVALAFATQLPAFLMKRVETGYVGVRQFQLRLRRIAIADLLVSLIAVLLLLPLLAGDARDHAATAFPVIGAGLAVANAAGLAVLAVPWVRLSLPSPRAVVRLLGTAVPLGATNSISLIHNRADQLLLAFLGYRVGLAEYAIAYRVVDAALAMVTAANGVAFPLLVRAKNRGHAARRMTVAYAGLGLALAVGAFAFAPLLIAALGGDRYEGATRLLRLLSPCILVFVLNSAFAQLAIVQRRALQLLYIVLLGTVINVVANVVLVHIYGVPGAAIATLISGILSAAAVAFTARRSLGESLLLGPSAALVAVGCVALLTALFLGSDHGNIALTLMVCALSLGIIAATWVRPLRALRSDVTTAAPAAAARLHW